MTPMPDRLLSAAACAEIARRVAVDDPNLVEDVPALLATVAALRDALKPFGTNLSAYLTEACEDDENLGLFTARFDFSVHEVSAGDLKRAAAVYAETGP